MATRFLSVCMFCLLCATHSPCESHAEIAHEVHTKNSRLSSKDAFKSSNSRSPDLLETKSRIGYSQEHTINTEDETVVVANIRSKKSIKRKEVQSEEGVHTVFQFIPNKTKSNFDKSNKFEDVQYLKKIFEKYGNGDTMTLKGFEKFMKDLAPKFQIFSEDADIEQQSLERLVTSTNSTDEKCLDHKQIYSSVLSTEPNITNITSNTLKKMCPVILYNMIFESCSKETEDVYLNESSVNKYHLSIWLYSNLAVVLVSVCGVMGLAVIPIMQKWYYQSLLQFLVALAVGTLSGDALLHLLPHAMSSGGGHGHESSEHHHHEHTTNMWKGLVAMMGLVFFFFTEKIIIFGAKWRKKVQMKKRLPKMKVMKSADIRPPVNGTERQCKHKYSSIPYCYDAITMMEASHCQESIDSHNDTATTTFNDIDSECEIQSFKKSNSNNSNKIESNQNMTECPKNLNGYPCTEGNRMLPSQNSKDSNSIEEFTVILREHENKHHGHSHTHGHVHAAPQNLSSVAWMVIMGDGLHNFTDGMAIGAAFSGGIAGGFSTAVAVFCHELPHELGDFAMLLKAGMSMKQALFYNLLSSVLCLMGNAFGVWLGEMESATAWVFAAAAGMFIYIALVDMIPELSSNHDEDSSLLQCFLHLSGLILGCAIMTLIALYEHDLKNIFHEPL